MTKFMGTLAQGLGRRSVLLVAVGAASVASVGGVSYALTSDTQAAPAPSSVAPAPATVTAASTSAKGRVTGRVGRILKRAVHIEVVLPAPGGGFRTVDVDRGTVTALTSSSITVTPADGNAPITDVITSSTRQPKVPVASGQAVLLVSSSGDALIIRHARSATATNSATGSTSS